MMKRLLMLCFPLLMLSSFSAYGADNPAARILVAYFTMPESAGVDAVAGASRVVADGKVYGNTRWVAERILEATGGSRFVIETAQKYPAQHDALVKRGEDEKKRNARPKLAARIENLDAYDVVFIGYPVWWTDLPMPLYSFFEDHDFSGKTIIPFSTHGGSGFAGTIATIAALEPKAAVVRNGFTVSRNVVARSGRDIAAWVRGLNLK